MMECQWNRLLQLDEWKEINFYVSKYWLCYNPSISSSSPPSPSWWSSNLNLAKNVLTRAVPPEFQSFVSVEGGEVGFDQQSRQRIYFPINNQRVLYLLSRSITNSIYCWSHQGGEGEWSRCNFCHTLAFDGHIVSQVHWKHLNMFMCQI